MRLRSLPLLAAAVLLLSGCLPLPSAPATPDQDASAPAGDGMPANMASHGILLTQDGVTQTPAAAPTPVPSEPVGDAVQIVAYVDPMCEHCRDFLMASSSYVLDLVEAGEVTFELHPIAILDDMNGGSSSRAVNAIAAVVDAQPDAASDLVTTLFVEQPAMGESNSTQELLDQATAAGATAPEVAAGIESEAFMPFVEASSTWALEQPAATSDEVVAGTPTIFVAGQQYEDEPADSEAFAAFVESLL